jgi:amidase
MARKASKLDPATASVRDLQTAMNTGKITARALVDFYLERIEKLDRNGPKLNSVLEVNPDARKIADRLDAERAKKGSRGPLHGVPVLVKDNIDTADKLHTSAGSLALAGHVATRDAFLVERLRAAGAIILGKANMTEWANFMARNMPSGYSSRGGQVVNPFDPKRTPGGSSAGSGVAVSAGLCAVAVGTETSGSILSPANQSGVVGLKPTVGLISRSGIIPIAASQDTAGPMARTVSDAAVLLGAMTGVDTRDKATRGSKPESDYTAFLDADGLRGARIGVPRAWFMDQISSAERDVFEVALQAMREAGASVIEADIPTMQSIADTHPEVLFYEFRRDLNAYLRTVDQSRLETPIRNLKDLVRFNEARPQTMLRYGQTLLLASLAAGGTRTETYRYTRERDLQLSRTRGIDATLQKHRLDALVTPSFWGCIISAKAGYPSLIVPAGFTAATATEPAFPVGVTFFSKAWSEGTLIRLGFAFEQAAKARRAPKLKG